VVESNSKPEFFLSGLTLFLIISIYNEKLGFA